MEKISIHKKEVKLSVRYVNNEGQCRVFTKSEIPMSEDDVGIIFSAIELLISRGKLPTDIQQIEMEFK